MSMAPQALERSVLERKERDELAAIAEAMGVKPSSRASKATLIDQILREAGIETGTEGKPKRTRSSRLQAAANNGAAEAPVATDGSPVGDATSAETAPVASDGAAEPVPTNGAGAGEAAAAARPDVDDGAPEPVPAAAASSDGEAAATTNVATPDVAAGAPTTTDVAADVAADGSAEAPADGSAEAPAGSADARTAPAVTNGAPASPEAATVPPASDQEASARTDERPREQREQREHREQRDQRDQRGQRDSNRGGGQNVDTGEPGNRRSRRRRGRDRSDRDIQQDRGQDPQQYSGELVEVEGLLDLRDEGYGFLRTSGYLPGSRDAYVSLSQVRRFALRKGDYLKGASRPAATNEKYPALLRIDTVNGMTPDEARGRPRFEDLTPLFPDQKLRLEIPGDSNNMIARIVDLVSPIGKGQRGLIVSPPKAGKTTVLKQIAHSIEANNPEVKLMVLLVDERPEEVTDFRRSVKGGEVIASTFDRPSDEHAQVAELTLERAKRLVELSHDVVIVLDGITRLSRAYNLAAPATGRIMSGGLDVNALYPPKKFFGAARNIEEGGSLTIIATALVETGSKMDEVIFEEFKGTGNMELKLDRKLAERRIYPALDVNASSTRHEELLFDRGQLPQVWKLRRVLNALEPGAGLELLMDKIKSTKGNDEFLAEIAKAPAPAI
jgi:transcription termination factor Rho